MNGNGKLYEIWAQRTVKGTFIDQARSETVERFSAATEREARERLNEVRRAEPNAYLVLVV